MPSYFGSSSPASIALQLPDPPPEAHPATPPCQPAMVSIAVNEAVFAVLDKDADGKLGAADLGSALRCAGREEQDKILEAMARGKGSEDGLTYDAFKSLVSAHGGHIQDKDIVPLVFGMCGQEDEEVVGPEALGSALKLLGMEATPEEVAELIREFDEDGDGKLSRDEVAALLTLPC
mmetsp:Transcript_5322/g.11104  ORF Transcript_5322/g.11104 Transcript_5322/m.11104 type:complete len:177 (-) Transcript_5322:115-645(-)